MVAWLFINFYKKKSPDDGYDADVERLDDWKQRVDEGYDADDEKEKDENNHPFLLAPSLKKAVIYLKALYLRRPAVLVRGIHFIQNDVDKVKNLNLIKNLIKTV